MISDGGSDGVKPSGRWFSPSISTLPSGATRPKCSFLMALSSAARGTGCVRLGLALRCSMLRMWRFTASTISPWPEEEFFLIWDREQEGQSASGASTWSCVATTSGEEAVGEASTTKIVDMKNVRYWENMMIWEEARLQSFRSNFHYSRHQHRVQQQIHSRVTMESVLQLTQVRRGKGTAKLFWTGSWCFDPWKKSAVVDYRFLCFPLCWL